MKPVSRYALAAMLVLACTACGNTDNEEAEETDWIKMDYLQQVNEVEVMKLKRTSFSRELISNGRLYATRKSALYFGTNGKIDCINAKNGDRVASDAVIAQLSRPDLELSLESARINLKSAELSLSDFLAGQGYPVDNSATVPQSLMETGKIKSGYSSAKNNLDAAQQGIDGTVLKAPFSGRVADIVLHRYDQSGSEPFCTIIDDSSLDVDFTIMESEYSFVSEGLPVKVTPFADQSREYAGKVVSINPSVDANGRISVRARVKNDGKLIDGMNVKVTVERLVPDKLVVPRSAVVVRDNLDVLFTYSEGKAHWVYVNILLSNGDSYAIEANKDRNSELEEGAEVIISGNLNLGDNSEVTRK